MVSTADSAALAPPATLAGPIVAAIGGVDPDSVIRATRRLQPHVGGTVLPVAVAEPSSTSVIGSGTVPLPPNYFDDQRKALDVALHGHLRKFDGCVAAWTPHIMFGLPAPALTDYARAANASLLVMGLGQHRLLDRVFGSETTLQAIRLARCPVLAVHPDLDSPFRDAVIATDFSAASAFAARAALPLLADNATLHLVHVWQPSATHDARGLTSDERYRQTLPDRFRRFESAIALRPDVSVKTIVLEGRTAECVIDYARGHHADLVVTGRRGLNVLHRIFVGSQTTALLRGAPCSLLVVPEPPSPIRERLWLLLDDDPLGTAVWSNETGALY
jgi:nucleotide-binding universal stress UspA family protein